MKHRIPRRKLKHNFTLLALIEFLTQARLYYPVAVLAYAEVAGSFTLAMSVFSVSFIAQTLLEIPFGLLSDKKGRRTVLIFGCATEFLAVFCYALSYSSDYGLGLLYLGTTFYGACCAAYSGNNNAMLYETLVHYKKPNEIAHILGRINAMGQGALASVGALTTLLLWLGFSFQDLMIFTLLPVGLGLLLSVFTLDPPHTRAWQTKASSPLKEALRLMLQNPRLAWFSGASAFNLALSSASNSFTPGFVASLWPVWLTPFYRTGQHIIGVICFWLSGRVSRRFGERSVLLVGTLVSKMISLMAYLTSWFVSPLLLMLTQVFYAVTHNADNSLQQKLFSNEQRSTMGSIISLAGAVLGAGLALLLGALADAIGPAYALAILSLAALPVSLIYWKMGLLGESKTNHSGGRKAKTL